MAAARASPQTPPGRPEVSVFAPSALLTITVEPGHEGDAAAEVHVHVGGQGYWLARLLRSLGHRPVLCTALGGETGAVLRCLLAAEDFDVELVDVEAPTPTYIHDRREGARREIVRTHGWRLSRHDADDLYGVGLRSALAAGTCVMTGRPSPRAIGVSFYERLGADLASNGVVAVGDLHGEELDACLRYGRLAVLKVSDEDLREDGRLVGDDEEAAIAAAQELAAMGADLVVVSRGERPIVARADGRVLVATPPTLRAADHHGAGDSMTAALVSATLQGLGPDDALRRACAAGAANVTRHGLTTLEPSLIDELAVRVQLRSGGRSEVS